MPKPKSSRSASAAPSAIDRPAPLAPAEALRARADALFRVAAECCRQHERYAHLVEHEVDDGEQRAAVAIVDGCDRALRDAVTAYEGTAQVRVDEPWWHPANALWMASREYLRRHSACDQATRRLAKHSPAKLGELTLDYDLEASALLALHQAIAGYRKVRPEAELNGSPRRTAR